jgi:DNA repair protein RecN (Recombination protein N)
MLQDLTIRNFAIIDDLHIRFDKGLTILTGETGAGKSIILNAVTLLLGTRASTKMIRSREDSAELEAVFAIPPDSEVARSLEALDYPSEDTLLIRRIIARNKRHRIFINERVATLQTLAQIAGQLAGISGQHAYQGLLQEDQHLFILDQYGGLLPARNAVREQVQMLAPLLEKRQSLEGAQARQAERIELLQFQQAEIARIAPAAGEDMALEQEQTRLKNAEALLRTAHDGMDVLYNRDGSVSERVGMLKRELEKAQSLDEALSKPALILSETLYLIEDVVDALRTYSATLEVDDRRLESVEARLDELNRLKRKYGGSMDAVLNTQADIDAELKRLGRLENDIDQLDRQLAEAHRRLDRAVQNLSERRQQAAETLARKVETELASLKMAKTRFAVSLHRETADDQISPYLVSQGMRINEYGIDRASFQIAPNVGEALKPLTAIASGGELSRVVLALKAILATTAAVETVIFDEVDAGIGGAVAEVVGRKLAGLARHHQVICITHLPQIAVFGNAHFQVSKQVIARRTRTQIVPIEKQARVEEIARMLGGETLTATSLAHAQEMLQQP